VDLVVSSENFRQITPSEVDLYKNADPNGVVFVQVNKMIHQDEETGGVQLGALAAIRITNGDIVRIMEKISRIVANTQEGVEYKLNKLFSEDKNPKRYGPPPGTLRIFGPGLVSFYTGKGWRRVNLLRKSS
jgi:hypothetical protein